jgi:transcriptional regulator with XRE-family HTH domain
MDQMKIGAYLKELRKGKDLTQEQIAEKFGVSQRSVSRWENGYTMPDISVLIELADYYDVDLREILNGEGRTNDMNEDLKETLVMVAEYTNEEKKKLVSSLYSMIWTCIVAFSILMLINVFHLTRESTTWDTTAIFCSAVGLIYAISCFVRVLQLSGKIDKKSHSKVIIASLILAGSLFILTIVAVLYGCGIIG